MTERRYCKYEGCGKLLVTQRADAKFCGKDCRNAYGNEQRRMAGAADKRLTTGSEAEGGHGAKVRLLSEVASDGELAERFRPLIRTAIFDKLRTTGQCHADDLADVYPEGHVSLCRHLATAHFGQLARRKMIQKVEWRKSTAPGRNGGGSWIWKFTDLGREKYALVGSSSGNHPEQRLPSRAQGGAASPGAPARAASDEKPGAGVPNSSSHAIGTGSSDQPLAGVGADERHNAAAGLDSAELPVSPAPISVDPGESSAGGRGQALEGMSSAATGPADATPGGASPEPLTLLSDEVGVQGPKSAFTDQEWAA